MVRNPIEIWFDFVDPASILTLMELEAARRDQVEWVVTSDFHWFPLELRPPPTPLIGVDDPAVADLWEEARDPAERMGLALAPPPLVPWTRKAHELLAHASDADPERVDALRTLIAHAYAVEGRDIGRVDVLVDLAIAHGLDRTETRAVLDVDRYEAEVAAAAQRAAAAGVSRTPTLVRGDTRVEGFHNCTVLSTLLGT